MPMSDYDTHAPRMYDDIPPRPSEKEKKKFSASDRKAFIKKAKKSVQFFSKYFCRVDLTPFQVEETDALMKDDSSIHLSCRGGGKSLGFSCYDTRELSFRENPDGSRDLTHLYAPITDQAMTIFNYVEEFVEKNKVLESFVKRHKVGGTLKFKNDNELVARSASPSAQSKSKHPDKLQMDESQKITDEKYYEDLLPSGAAKGARIQETGTPAGRNHFWATWHEESDYKKVLQEKWTDCPYMMPGYCLSCKKSFKVKLPLERFFKCPHCGSGKRQYDYVMKLKGKLPKRKFLQEFECKWDVNIGMVWAYSLIKKMLVLPDVNQGPYPQFTYFAGVDVAKSPAETVVSVGYAKGDELEQCYLKRIADRETWPEIEKEVYEALAMFQPWTCIDATKGSQGDNLYDHVKDLCEKNGENVLAQKLDPVHYDDKIKVWMADQVDILGANSRLRLLDNNGQRKQVIAYRMKTTAHGRTTFYSEPGVLSDVPQADMLMVKAFLDKYGSDTQGDGFSYAVGGQVGGSGFKRDDTYYRGLQGAKRPE